MVGDLLLAWSLDSTPEQGRGAGWQMVCQIGNGCLWQQSPTNHWRGFPLYNGIDGKWHYWLLGELVGTVEEQINAVLDGHLSASQLNGHFFLWAWHEVKRQWHLWTNRLGTFHAYYGMNGRRAAVGTFCPAVAQAVANHQLDWYGLAGFFSWGFFPQDRTHYEAVRMLRPATHITLAEDGRLCQQTRYWHWSHTLDRTRSYDETIDEFAHNFDEVLAEQTANGRVALPISGGLDSRSIVAAVTDKDRSHTDFWAYTYGYSADSIEIRIAQQVARARQLPCHSYLIQPYLFANLDKVMACVEGFQDVTQCRQAAIAEPLHQNTDVVLAGHWGDVWLDTMGLPSQDKADVTDIVIHKLEKRGRDWLLDNFGLQEQVTHLREQVGDDLQQYAYLGDLDFRVKAFKTDQWSWRWTTASLRMFQTAVFPRLPFYDNRLVDFFCTIPSDFLAGRRLQIDYLKRFAPDLARIPWQLYQTNLFRYQHFHSWLFPVRILRKAKRMIKRQKVLQRNWEVQFGQGNGRQQLHDCLLAPGQRVHEFLPRTAIQSLLDTFYQQPEGKIGYTVSMLLTFTAWLEQYG